MAKDKGGHGSEKRRAMGMELRAVKALQAKSAHPTRHSARISELQSQIKAHDQRSAKVAKSRKAQGKPKLGRAIGIVR